MRIAHIITRLIVGGAQENTVASVLGLRERAGVEVRLISGPTRGPEGSLENALGSLPGLLTLVPSLVRPVNPWQDVRALSRLTRLLRQWSPDIVHTHSGKAGILGRLAARRAHIPIIVHTIHGPSFGAFQGLLPNLAFRTAERFVGGFTSHFVCVAHAMRDQYLAAGIGQPAQYTRVFSGFAVEPFLEAAAGPAPRARWGLAPDDFVIGKIARLFRLKGHDDLLEASPEILRRCPQARFFLIGDGIWRERLEAKAEALGVRERVVFAGLVSPAEIPACVASMDVLVHLSRREGLARALPQALAAARPVVAYDCDGAREVCLDGETGFLVAPGDLRTLVDRIWRFAQDACLRRRFGEQGCRWVRERFPVERMVEDLHGLYRRLRNPRTDLEWTSR